MHQTYRIASGSRRRNVPVNVQGRAEVLLVRLVEVAHANLPEVTWMELVKKDAVVVQATRVTAASRMLAVLADTAMAGRHVPPLFPVLVKMGRLRTSHGRQEQEEQSCRGPHGPQPESTQNPGSTGHSTTAQKTASTQERYGAERRRAVSHVYDCRVKAAMRSCDARHTKLLHAKRRERQAVTSPFSRASTRRRRCP